MTNLKPSRSRTYSSITTTRNSSPPTSPRWIPPAPPRSSASSKPPTNASSSTPFSSAFALLAQLLHQVPVRAAMLPSPRPGPEQELYAIAPVTPLSAHFGRFELFAGPFLQIRRRVFLTPFLRRRIHGIAPAPIR